MHWLSVAMFWIWINYQQQKLHWIQSTNKLALAMGQHNVNMHGTMSWRMNSPPAPSMAWLGSVAHSINSMYQLSTATSSEEKGICCLWNFRWNPFFSEAPLESLTRVSYSETLTSSGPTTPFYLQRHLEAALQPRTASFVLLTRLVTQINMWILLEEWYFRSPRKHQHRVLQTSPAL